MQPGEETTVSVSFSMHEGMGGPHAFQVLLPSNDAVEPTVALTVKASYPRP